jgi:toxin ParE1/3/4
MKPVRFHRLALAELDEAAAYYEQQETALGKELREEVEQTVERIQQTPGIGPSYMATRFRSRLVQRFPYAVIYLEKDDAIWIAAVAHERRKPGYWSRRKMG